MTSLHPFTRGFLLWPAGALPTTVRHLVQQWPRVSIGSEVLYFDPLSKHTQVTRGEVQVCVLGTMVDVLNFNQGHAAITAQLANAVQQDFQSGDSEGQFPALASVLRRLSGSHIVIFACAGRCWISLDATGTFPACYATQDGRTSVASHPMLLGKCLGRDVSDVARNWMAHEAAGAGGRYMPGLLTVIDGVEILVPNHFFELASARHHRFFPARDFELRNLEEIVDKVVPMLSGQLTNVAQSCRPVIGLSGGLDSRLTLAASREISRKASYFTYYSETNHILSNDISIAEKLKERLNLTHFSFPAWSNASKGTIISEVWAQSTGGVQGPVGLNGQFAKKFTQKDLHIRSNILETVRGFYSKNPVNRKPDFDAYKLSRLFRRATADEFTTYFEDFIEKTQFNISNFRGYHYTDMFYWEHRLAAWLGPMLRGNRLCFDTYIIYNCRLILELMMALPMEQRNSADLVIELIRRLWPETLEIDIFSGSKILDLRT